MEYVSNSDPAGVYVIVVWGATIMYMAFTFMYRKH